MNKATQKLLNGSIIYFFGNAMTQLLSLLLLRFVTGRISPEEYGTYNLIVNIANLVIPCATLQIADAIFRFFIVSKSDEERKKYFTATCYIAFSGVLAIFAGVIVASRFMTIPHPFLVALYMVFSGLFTLYQRIARGLGHSKLFVAGNLLRTVIYLGLEILFIYVFNLGIEALLLAVIISHAIFLFFTEINIKSLRYFDIGRIDLAAFKEMIKYSLPLIPNAIFWWLTSSINTVIVSTRCGLEMNGIYTVANKFSVVLSMVTSVFAMAWQESAISEYGNDKFKSFYTNTFNTYAKGVFTAIATLIPIVFLVFPSMIDKSYHDSTQYAPFLIVATGISSMSGFVAQVFAATSKNHKSLFTNILGMAINISLIFLLVDRLELWAAVVATIFADFSILSSRLFLTRKEFTKELAWPQFVIVLVMLIVSFLCYFYMGTVFNVLWLIISIVLAIMINWTLIKDLCIILLGKVCKPRSGVRE